MTAREWIALVLIAVLLVALVVIRIGLAVSDARQRTGRIRADFRRGGR